MTVLRKAFAVKPENVFVKLDENGEPLREFINAQGGNVRGMTEPAPHLVGDRAPVAEGAPDAIPEGARYKEPKSVTARKVYSDTPLPKAKVPSLGEIRRYYAEAFNVPMRFGFGPGGKRKALGYYTIKGETIHLRNDQYNNLGVITHELGHALHAMLYPATWKRDRDWQFITRPDIRVELEALCVKNFGENTYKPNERVSEGVAEFLRMLHTDPDRAVKECPKFNKELQRRLDENPDVKKVLLNGIALAHKHLTASPLGRVQSAIFRGDWNVGLRRTLEHARVKFAEMFIDRDAPILAAELPRFPL